MTSSIFRKVSLDRLSSPEQLDLLMQVTSPRSWLAFLALALLVATAVYWAIFGQISLQQTATAALIPTGGIKNVIVAENGQLFAWHVTAGESVAENQIVAEILPLGKNAPVPVRSLHNGRILQLNTVVGQLLRSGDSLASLQSAGADENLEAVFYLSPAAARQLRVGMPVTVEPVTTTNVDALFGVVTAVSQYPVSTQQITHLLGSEALARNLALPDNPIEVRVLLETDTAVAQLSPGLIGTLASATIQVGAQRPIELVLPLR
ncbi:MAG: HlyD family efflux transporter periplasmic adaptor subunit [Chloroflexi bacterium]|nr:HlyD family efflux transporter periplasmic adaptor subunit [Chloroflexota bacterium]